jgi:hypothetical protein
MKKISLLALIVILLATTSPVKAAGSLPRTCFSGACGTPVCITLDGPNKGEFYPVEGTVPGFYTCQDGDLMALILDLHLPIAFR